MPNLQANLSESLHAQAVTWIHENSEDNTIPGEIKQGILNFNESSFVEQNTLILAITKLKEQQEEKGESFPEVVQQWLPPLFEILPTEKILEIGDFLKDVDVLSLATTSQRMYTVLPSKRTKALFLQQVAYGEQDFAEKLFKDVYKGQVGNRKIQDTLRHPGIFKDRAGRIFNCTAYEYAYWAKDTHMCRMLEGYMDEKTKALILQRIDEIEREGLTYQHHGQTHCSKHFDFSTLIEALEYYVNNYLNWFGTQNWQAMKVAWANIGSAQDNVPAHVAQEYCRKDRSFRPCPKFDETTLPRSLAVFDFQTNEETTWFLNPLTDSKPTSVAYIRGKDRCERSWGGSIRAPLADLNAMIRLDDVRTKDLIQSRKNLNATEISQSMTTFATPQP
jgi:hypothetical protein